MTNNKRDKKHLKLKLLFTLLCISFSFSFAQVTTIKGSIKDSSTKEPIPFSSISFDNSNFGTYSDNDGSFSISNNRGFTDVKIQVMGYEELRFSIPLGQITTKEILLETKDNLLSEIIVKPKKEKYSKKDNPAVELIKKVIANKKKNSITAQEYYQYKEYERFIFAFNEFDPNSGMFKKYKFLPNYVDTSIINKKPILPFSVKEKVTDVFYRSKPKTEKRIIKGQKSEGIDQKLEQQGIEAFIQETFKDVNIFDNYITMLLNNFVGPLSDQQAVSFYKWYLSDTVTIDNDRYVQLDFAPFNNRDIGFTGNLYISLDSMYAVKKAVLKAPKNINVNWVTDMVVHQDFTKDEKGVWVPLEYRTAMDMSMYDALKVHVDKTVTIEDFIANMPIAPIYDLPDPEIFEKDYSKRPNDFWVNHRPDAHKTDYKMDELVHEMKDVFLIKMVLNLGNILMTGYVPLDKDPETNKVEIGTVPTFYSYNKVEGNRFRLTGSTTKKFHPNLFLYGYGAYGTKDEKFKYMGEATWSFRKVKDYKEEYPVNNLSFSYKYDMNALGQEFTQAERDNILMSLSSTNKIKMTYDRRMTLAYHKEYYGGFSFKLQAQTNDQKAANLLFEKHSEVGIVTPVENIKTTEATALVRYAHNEKFFQQKRRRVPIPTEKLITQLSHTVAIKDFLGGQYNYNKTTFSVEKDFWVTPYGKLNINGKAEKVWGKAPFISLISPSANSSFTLQAGSFYLLEPLEFMHDQQVSWEIYYRMGGLIFNRIPLLKLLKWREVIGFRGFYGTLSDKNNPAVNHNQMVFPENTFRTTGKEPYMEYNIGIENIFNFFRIDYVRRVNYTNHPGINKSGFRFSFQFEF